MAYEIAIEELTLPNHSVMLDCTIEIDAGGPGDWAIECMTIPSFNGEADIFVSKKDVLFHIIKDAIMADPKTVAYIDGEAEENNTPSLMHDPDWH